MVTALQRGAMAFGAFIRVGIIQPTCMESDQPVVFLDLVVIGRKIVAVIAATATTPSTPSVKELIVRVLRQVRLLRRQAVVKADRGKHIHEAVREGRILNRNRRSVDVDADQRFRNAKRFHKGQSMSL